MSDFVVCDAYETSTYAERHPLSIAKDEDMEFDHWHIRVRTFQDPDKLRRVFGAKALCGERIDYDMDHVSVFKSDILSSDNNYCSKCMCKMRELLNQGKLEFGVNNILITTPSPWKSWEQLKIAEKVEENVK